MSTPQKLTKKQRKSLTFRQKKGKGKAAAVDDEERDVPVLENLDFDSETPKDEETSSGDRLKPLSAVKKGKEKDVGANVEQDIETARTQSKKRKRLDKDGAGAGDEDAGRSPPKPKKPRGAPGSNDEDVDPKEGKDAAKGKKPRYILFVGNLKYTTSKDLIEKHFAACDPPPQVRLLTPKSTTKITTKSKGCAFLEFSHKNSLQQALKLHQSELDGRKINVELTAGGGGKSEARLEKVKQRNKGLAGQRIKRIQKGDGTDQEPDIERPQRHSTTSGIDEMPLKKRTWTIDDVEDGTTHRGGKKHNKTRGPKRKAKDWGTGVNSIPVG